MKFRVSMKDPDCLDDPIREAVEHEVTALKLPKDEASEIAAIRQTKVRDLCVEKWFEYGEYLEVDIDTEAGTCVVVPRA